MEHIPDTTTTLRVDQNVDPPAMSAWQEIIASNSTAPRLCARGIISRSGNSFPGWEGHSVGGWTQAPVFDTYLFVMMSRRTVLLLSLAALVILCAFLLPKPPPPVAEAPVLTADAAAALTNGRAPTEALSHRASVFPDSSRPLTTGEEELKRLEREFYREFPLALKYREYLTREGMTAQMEGLTARFKSYMEEPSDPRESSLRTDILNRILQLEAPLMIKELLVTDSELGQMLRVAFEAPRWDWDHLLRNLDSRIDWPTPRPTVKTPEQLVLALQERGERIREYCQEKQAEASMPDSIREDIRAFTLDLLARGVAEAYLETVMPADLKEARSRAAREAKARSLP